MKILTFLRPDTANVVKELLARGHKLWMPKDVAKIFKDDGCNVTAFDELGSIEESAPLQEAIAKRLAVGEPSMTREEALHQFQNVHLKAWVKSVSEVVWDLHEQKKFDAMLVWSDALPGLKSAILTAKHLNIPTIEIKHSGLSGYRQAHFEIPTYCDYILVGGQHHVDFLEFYGSKAKHIITGRPHSDWATKEYCQKVRTEARHNLKKRAGEPIILYAMTWVHALSCWGRYTMDLHEADVIAGFIEIEAKMPGACLVVKPHPAHSTGKGAPYVEKLKNALKHLKVDIRLVEANVSLILPAADLVVSPHSGILVEAVLCGIPAIGMAVQEFHDFRFHPGVGIEWVEDKWRVGAVMKKCLFDKVARTRLAIESIHGVRCFNDGPPGDAYKKTVDAIEKIHAER